MRKLRSKAVVAFTLLAAIACGDGGGPGAGAKNIALQGGDNQVAAAGTVLPTPLSVLVTDRAGSPVPNVTVTWAATAAEGSVSASTSVTDASGIATITRTLGANAGTQNTTASRAGLTGSPVTFTSISQIQGATQIAASDGSGQQDTVKSSLPNPYRVIVRDQNNAPVANVIVDWAVTAGGGSVSSAKDTTDASGIAVVSHTFGTAAGAQAVQASVAGLVGSPVTFTSTATAGHAASIEISGGNNQTARVSAMAGAPYGVLAKDSYGNPKQGVTINWAVETGSGSFTPTQNTTGANGIATSTRATGANTGTYTDTATSTGLTGSPLLFTVTAIVAPTSASVGVGAGGVNAFSPDSVLIAQGGTVTFNWTSGVTHNVTFTTPGAPGSIASRNTGSQTATFTNAGTFAYQCTLHAGMRGKVVVLP